jgi:hypothetical protein
MGRDSVITALRGNIDKTVELHFADGETQTASIIHVNDEGVVYDLIGSNRQGPNLSGTAIWATFEEIMAVSPSQEGQQPDALLTR